MPPKADDQVVSIYDKEQLIARHQRARENHQVVEDPSHQKGLPPSKTPCRRLDNNPGGSVGYRKNAFLRFDPFIADIFLKPVGGLLRQKGNLRFIAALWVLDEHLSVFDILGCKVQNLAPSQTTPGMISRISLFLGFRVLKMISSVNIFCISSINRGNHF